MALRVERGSARRALAALRADEDTDDGDARPSNDGDVSATNSVDGLMTSDDEYRRSGPRTRAGQRNQVASRADCGSARRASSARRADEDPDNDDARPSNDDDDGGDRSVRQSDSQRRAARRSQAHTTAAPRRRGAAGASGAARILMSDATGNDAADIERAHVHATNDDGGSARSRRSASCPRDLRRGRSAQTETLKEATA